MGKFYFLRGGYKGRKLVLDIFRARYFDIYILLRGFLNFFKF